MKLQRWNDWLLLVAMVCFIGATLGNLALLLGVEQPTYDELERTYVPHGGSGPGHFLPGGLVCMVRFVATVSAMGLGVLFALVGSLRIPRDAASSRKLRDATWITFCVALAVCLGIAMM
jgi:integral membrane sensor domain MASE1